ncbi:class I SAM-dependent methyltransferase [Enhygromyxa salina]|uniref:Methyltransferase domain protein n=1 Tax=Enhygromyxa salina TaxID=215803 RepID=A0A2S9YRJ9_9BACT|nr:class I SAM-dependent methyltransferase [Enhygromyxa salina]PRQ07689.1 Methyltransferase domain protein [Enhygromyxa salina]
MSTDYPARFYAAVHDGNPGDVDFYRERCAGSLAIVELGCGDARVLGALAEHSNPGVRVGVDIDAQLLELAAARAPGIEFVCADMCSVGVEQLGGRRFDRVIIPYGGLYCLLTEAAVAATLAKVVELLADDGLLLLDVWAADGFHAEADPDDQDPSWLERVKIIELDGHRYEVLERSSWDKPHQRIDATYLHVRVGAEEAIEGTLCQRYLLADQLRSALELAGLEIVELAGGFNGQPYTGESELMVVSARRRRGL